MTGYAHYGILIATDAGERGWIEGSYVADGPIRREEWPEVGARIVGVVLGYTSSGRIRLATTPSYVAAIRGSEDPDAAASAWWVMIDVDGHGIVAIDEDDKDAMYSASHVLTSTSSARDRPGIDRGVRVLVEVQRRLGGIAPRALLGAEFIARDSSTTLIEVGVAAFEMLDSDDQPKCRSRLWKRPFTGGLPTDLADSVLRGLTAEPGVALPPGVLRVDRAGFDIVNSSEPVFTQAASLLRLAIATKLHDHDPGPVLRAAIQSW